MAEKVGETGSIESIEEGGAEKEKDVQQSQHRPSTIDPVEEPTQKIAKKRTKKKKTKVGNSLTKPNDKRPFKATCFVAVPIKNESIKDAIKSLQAHLVKTKPALETALIKISKLHLTLAVMQIDQSDETSRGRMLEIMDECEGLLDSSDAPITFDLHGLGHFSSGVLYAKVKEGKGLDKLNEVSDKMRALLEASSIPMDSRGFEPHLTVMKFSKMKWSQKKAVKKIDVSLYEDFKDIFYGVEDISNLQLLSMTGKDAETGYYVCLKEVSLFAK